jgi:signal transduction histidine kinase
MATRFDRKRFFSKRSGVASSTLEESLVERTSRQLADRFAWLLNPAGILVVVAIFSGLLAFISLAMDVGKPFGGFLSYTVVANDVTVLRQETPEWWELIRSDTLQYVDQLTLIDGQPYYSHSWEAYQAAYETNRPVELEIFRITSGQLLLVALPVTLFNWFDFVDMVLPELVVGISFILLAVILLNAGSRQPVNRIFAALAACVAIHRLTVSPSIAIDLDPLTLSITMVHLIAAGLIAPLTIHLTVEFPKPFQRKPKRALLILYATGLISGLVLAILRIPAVTAAFGDIAPVMDQLAYHIELILTLIAIIVLFTRLVWFQVFSSGRKRESRMVSIVLIGLIISLPSLFLLLKDLFPDVSLTSSTFWNGLDLRYLLLAVPIAFSLAIIRYQTFQVPSRLFILVIILALSALLAAVGVWVWRFFQPDLSGVAVRPPFVTFFTVILIASMFWSQATYWQGWFGRFLHREDRNYESARSFGAHVMGSTDLRVLPDQLARTLVTDLELERACVWLWKEGDGCYDLVAFAGNNDPPLSARLVPTGEIPTSGRALYVAAASTPSWLGIPANHGGIEVIIPLMEKGQAIGYLGLGRRWDEEIFDARDLTVAELIGQQATLFILAARQVEELRRVPGLVAEAQERERYRLAGELHDTIQQFLGRLPFYLAVSRDLIRKEPDEAADLLERCLTDVEGAAAQLRSIRVSLAPNHLETSLIGPVRALASQVEQREGLDIVVLADQELDYSTTIESRHALYRVIQQALDNTVSHAHATQVAVALHQEQDRVMFSVQDNGQGSTDEERRQASLKGSFGVQSMQTRIEMVGGQFDFESTAGTGTIVSGWVPSANGLG